MYEQEGRGHGLLKKLAILERLKYGRNTAQACQDLGLEWDVRDYRHCASALLEWGIDEVTLMTNNPLKHDGLRAGGIVTHKEKHIHGVTPDNIDYLMVKATEGHELSPAELAMLAVKAQNCQPVDQ